MLDVTSNDTDDGLENYTQAQANVGSPCTVGSLNIKHRISSKTFNSGIENCSMS